MTILDQATERLHLDLTARSPQPSLARLLLATVVALAGSLAVDAAVVAVGVAVFPTTKGYEHFRFGDYSTLTVIGVLIACAGWPIVARLCTRPRWLFANLAVLISVVLLLPDVAILVQGQPARAVTVLVAMHAAIAIVTYAALVLLAPATVRQRRARVLTDR